MDKDLVDDDGEKKEEKEDKPITSVGLKENLANSSSGDKKAD